MLTKKRSLNNIENELIIGLAGGLGVDFNSVSELLTQDLAAAGYHTEILRISDFFPEKKHAGKFAAEYWKMQYGTKQRQIFGNDYWAKRAIAGIFRLRPSLSSKHKKIAYIVRSLKNKQELDLLSNVYGRNFLAISVFSDEEASYAYLRRKLRTNWVKDSTLLKQIHSINYELGLSDEEIEEDLVAFLMKKDQAETHPGLKQYGQNLFKCYSRANFFVYENKNLKQQLQRFTDLLFNYPFAEPTCDEYFMFCAQAAAYRSLDLDRQVGAVIVNQENELVASGFNDVTKVGGGHFTVNSNPDMRDFKQPYDFGHVELDRIAARIAKKLYLSDSASNTLREEISGITEFKRSTHAEMSALLDASRRGVSIRDCTMYVNTYPCHNCTKHIIASGIKKIVFLHPYPKSKAREMYQGMIKHGIFLTEKDARDVIVFEPFLGVSPNRFMLTFANDKDSRLEKIGGKETGNINSWQITKDSIPRELIDRRPHSYISREWVVIHNNQLPDISWYYE